MRELSAPCFQTIVSYALSSCNLNADLYNAVYIISSSCSFFF